MYSYFTDKRIIPNIQCEFRKNVGTCVTLINVTDYILRILYKNTPCTFGLVESLWHH